MNIIDIDYVTKRMPSQYNYFWQDSNDNYSDKLLQLDIDDAHELLNSFIIIDDSSDIPSIKRHLFNIVRKMGFDRKHGDSSFETIPSIVKEYNATMEWLNNLKKGSSSVGAKSTTSSISVSSKPRLFGGEFGGFD